MSRLIFIIFFSTSYAVASSTNFIWILSPKDQLQGDCYQVDSETNGKKFKVRTTKDKCKPDTTDYVFYPSRGKCYEVDAKTEGKEYIKKVNSDLCAPKETITDIFKINDEAGCYTVDAKTKGQKFFKKERPKNCGDKNISSTYWEYIEAGKGKCYEGVISNTEEVKVLADNEKCRTSKTYFYFKRKNETSGDCIEEDSNDPKAYSNETKIENCRPSETEFIFYTPPRKKRGNCYELDSKTKGNEYINIVEPENCAPK